MPAQNRKEIEKEERERERERMRCGMGWNEYCHRVEMRVHYKGEDLFPSL